MFFYNGVAFLTIMELREAHRTGARFFRRVVEISQGCSSNAEAAVLLDTPRIRMAMDPDALPSTIDWVTFIAQPASTSWYQPRTANDSSQFAATRSHVQIGRSSLSQYVNSAILSMPSSPHLLQHMHHATSPSNTLLISLDAAPRRSKGWRVLTLPLAAEPCLISTSCKPLSG